MVAIINSSIPAPVISSTTTSKSIFTSVSVSIAMPPSYFFGLGYSFRIDGALQQRDRASTRSLEATPRLNLVTK